MNIMKTEVKMRSYQRKNGYPAYYYASESLELYSGPKPLIEAVKLPLMSSRRVYDSLQTSPF